MPNIELTSKFCDTAPEPTDKDRVLYWDAKLPEFALVVHKGGHRSFVVQYRANGQSRRMSIAGTKFAVAKKKAEQLLGQVHNGGDPLGEKRAERAARADTLQSIVEGQYLTHKSVVGQRSLEAKQSIFARNIFPALGSKPITEIKRSHIVTLLDDIEATKGHGAAEVAHKALASTSRHRAKVRGL